MRSVLLSSLCLTALLVGCHKKPPEAAPAPPAPAPAPAVSPAPAPQPVIDFPTEKPVVGEVRPDATALETVYFDYDQEALTDAARTTLQANAQWLRGNAGAKVRIEGNADDRGTIEYNLALGQRRADAVRTYLGSLGVQTTVLEVVSYGEEKPAVPGADETSWAQNRRADFVVVPAP